MAWVINDAGESVWEDEDDVFNKWINQYKSQRWGGEDYIDDGYDIPGVGKVGFAAPWESFKNSSAFGVGSTPESYRANMFNNGRVVDTPFGKMFVGDPRKDAPEMSAEPGAGIGGMITNLLMSLATAGIGAHAGAVAGAGNGGLNAVNSFDSGAMGEILGTGANTVPNSYWNMLADAGGTMTDVGMEGMGDMVNTLGDGGIDFNALNPQQADPFSFTPDPNMPNLNMPTFGSPNSLGLPEALGGGGAALNSLSNVASNATSWWDEILKMAQDPKSPLMKTGASLLEWLSSADNARYQTNTMNDAAGRADPFANERAFYQNLLRQSFTDPNFLKNNATFAGMRDVAVNDATRVAASQGYNRSSNVLYDVADRIQKQGANYLNQFQGNVGQFAGAGVNPATAANLQANAAQLGTQANQSANAARGNFLTSLPNLISSMKNGLA